MWQKAVNMCIQAESCKTSKNMTNFMQTQTTSTSGNGNCNDNDNNNGNINGIVNTNCTDNLDIQWIWQ